MTTTGCADELRGSAVFDAVAEIDRRYRRMRALIPDLDRPVADRGPLSAAQAEAVGRYVEAESHLATLRREPYSYIT